MKKQLLLLTALLCSMVGFSQGIIFETGTWKEVLAKAKQTNKPIFVDVYTTWCGPCKMMSKDVFPQEVVGTFFNDKFINYQIDAEKGEGVDLAKLYTVTAYPTYLFINPKGEFFYRFLGSMPAETFIEKTKEALAEYNDPKPIADWDKEYLVKKSDPVFFLEYMKKREKLGISNASLLDEYLLLLPEDQRTSDVILEFYKIDGYFLNVTAEAFKNLKANEALFLEKKLPVGNMMGSSIVTTITNAAKTKDEKQLNAAISAYELLPQESKDVSSAETLYMTYYKGTGDNENYVKYASQQANKLMKTTDAELVEMSKASVLKFEEDAKAGKFGQLNAENYAQGKNYFEAIDKSKIMFGLNENAWEVFKRSSDKNLLKLALGWSERTLQLNPESSQFLDTYANLLFKLGRQKEAIEQQEKAVSFVNKEDAEGLKNMTETLRKIKAGEKTW